MNSKLTAEESVNEIDRDAARRALARNWPNLDQASPKYGAMLKALAELHRRMGVDVFEVSYNLRPPKDRTEEWGRQFMQGEIRLAEFGMRLKAEAERPIDLEMLTTFCKAYEENLSHYSGVLQKAVLRPEQVGTSAWRENEKAIDEHVAILCGKLPLYRQNLETVFEFLEEQRILSGAGLVKLGGFEGTSAHWLAHLLFTRIKEAWQSCKEVSERSHRDPRYLYAAKAIDLFQQWLPKFPMPQSISERLREEFILARTTLNRTAKAVKVNPTTASDSSANVALGEQSIDNESRELVLIGEMFSLVGQAGHIFRPTPNSDWGIDGEIEFKDSTGQASGRRVYVQLKSGDSYLVFHPA